MKSTNEKYAKRINRVRKKINAGRLINRDIVKVFIFFTVLFCAMIVFLVFFLTNDAQKVINNSYNRRSETLAKTVTRGSILDRNGTVLAYSSAGENGTDTRIYPYGNAFAHVVGFDSNGRSGLEASYNYYLLTSHAGIFEKIANEFRSEKNAGDSLQTTLDAGLQEYISDLLGNNDGAVICMDPATGEILAMVSKPDFDPNDITEIWDDLVAVDDSSTYASDSSSVLINRVTQGLYTPGSTFKIFTLYEYFLEHPEMIDRYQYNCKGQISVGDTTISCLDGEAHGEENLVSAFANSCNCVFGTIGLDLDLARFRQTNERLLFGAELPIDIPSVASVYKLTDKGSDYDIMATAIGQGDTQMTPLHLAMVTSAIANHGICMKPHLASCMINSQGNTVRSFPAEEYVRLFSETEADYLTKCMRAVVTDGTGHAVYPGNFQAYGKTGTAQKEGGSYGEYDHSWFTGWAENDGQKLAVCVILENMDSANTRAVYVTESIFNYYFGY